MAEGTQLRGPSFEPRCCGGQDDRICTRRGETAPRRVLFSAQALKQLEDASMHTASKKQVIYFVRPSLDPAR